MSNNSSFWYSESTAKKDVKTYFQNTERSFSVSFSFSQFFFILSIFFTSFVRGWGMSLLFSDSCVCFSAPYCISFLCDLDRVIYIVLAYCLQEFISSESKCVPHWKPSLETATLFSIGKTRFILTSPDIWVNLAPGADISWTDPLAKTFCLLYLLILTICLVYFSPFSPSSSPFIVFLAFISLNRKKKMYYPSK